MKHCFGGSELFADFHFSLRVSESNPRTNRGMTVPTKTMWKSFFPDTSRKPKEYFFEVFPGFTSFSFWYEQY